VLCGEAGRERRETRRREWERSDREMSIKGKSKRNREQRLAYVGIRSRGQRREDARKSVNVKADENTNSVIVSASMERHNRWIERGGGKEER
jgi:type II secretory pathway component GspD/PulD (secretin)